MYFAALGAGIMQTLGQACCLPVGADHALSDPQCWYVCRAGSQPKSGSAGISGGAVAGIVIAVLAGVALLGALALFLFKRGRGASAPKFPTPNINHRFQKFQDDRVL